MYVAPLRYAVWLALSLMACQGTEAPASAPATTASQAPISAAPPALAIDQPDTCQGCHPTIYREWTESMHSRSHHANDPIFAALRSLRMKKQGPQLATKCAQCHTPRAPTALESPAALAGVSCAACHAVAAVGPGKGAKALTYADAVLRSARDVAPGASPVHGTGPALAAMRDGRTLCLACHGEMKNPAGVPMCTTGVEGGPDLRCTTCHMATEPGAPTVGSARATHASHRFAGPHRAWLQNDLTRLRDAVAMSAVARPDAVEVTLVNKSGHAFPSGFPGRMAVVHIVGLDATGAEVWRSQPGHEAGLLNKVYVDAAGKPTLPPFSVKMRRDARLRADETRVIRFKPPRPGATRVRVSIVYHLLPPPAAKLLGLAAAPEAQPMVLQISEIGVDAKR